MTWKRVTMALLFLFALAILMVVYQCTESLKPRSLQQEEFEKILPDTKKRKPNAIERAYFRIQEANKKDLENIEVRSRQYFDRG